MLSPLCHSAHLAVDKQEHVAVVPYQAVLYIKIVLYNRLHHRTHGKQVLFGTQYQQVILNLGILYKGREHQVQIALLSESQVLAVQDLALILVNVVEVQVVGFANHGYVTIDKI